MTPYEFIEAEKATFSVSELCSALDVSRSGYSKWRTAAPSRRAREDERLSVHVRAIHHRSRRTYGSPRVHAELRAQGQQVSRKRVERLMREEGLQARRKRRFRVTTESGHGLPVARNVLARRFTADAPDDAWVGDITYIWTAQGWLYLAVLLDLCSRRVVGWALRPTLSGELATEALNMALARRQPPRGLLHHTDRGCQYAANDYRKTLAARGIVCSMSRRGNCWDNAVAESFFATLKKELVHERDFSSVGEARRAVVDYIESFYNAERRHSALGYVSPVAFELAHKQSIAA
jgi:putative transposase